MRKISRYLFISALVFSCLAWSENPDLDWRTHESSNFLIHYPQELSHFLPRVTLYLEQSHDDLSEYFKWQPKNKTHVVLRDDVDEANGFAQPLPRNSITLFMQPPTGGELLVFDDWLKLLIHHEYTHTLHMDKVLGLPSYLRMVFGRIVFSFPNTFHPNWFAEGLATYQESKLNTDVGRGNSTFFEIMMRGELESGLKSLSRINTVVAHDWPLNTAYLYGVYFFKFIGDVYGEEAIKEMVNNYSDNIVPYRVDSNTISITGKSLSDLWVDFEDYLAGYFKPQIERIKSEGESVYGVISGAQELYGAISISHKNEVWYSAINNIKGPYLYRIKNDVEIPVVSLNSLATIDINKQSKLLISQQENCGLYGQFYDLFIFDPETEVIKRITTCSRYRLAKWLNKNRILGLRYVGGKPELNIINVNGEQIKNIWKGRSDSIITSFDVEESSNQSSEDFRVVASIKFGVNNWGLYEFSNSKWNPILSNSAVKSLVGLYSDDVYILQQYTGQSELYRLDKELKLTRLTHTYSGLKQVALLNNQNGNKHKAVGIRTNANGDEVVKFELNDRPSIYLSNDVSRVEDLVIPESEIYESDDLDYQPFSSLLPSYWFPVYLNNINTKQVGFFTNGSDALRNHVYTLQITQETETSSTLVNTSYIFEDQYFFNFMQSLNYYESVDVFEKKSQLMLGYMMPILTMKRQIYPYIALTHSDDYIFNENGFIQGSKQSRDNLIAVGLIYNEYQSTRWSSYPTSGWKLRASLESASLAGASVDDGAVFNFDAKHFYSSSWPGSIAQRLFLGIGVNSYSKFQLGGVDSDEDIGPGITVNQRRYPLRGFKSGNALLSGDNALLHSLEYRLPFNWLDNTFMTPPVGFNGWSLSLFADSGSVWSESEDIGSIYTGVGGELILDTTLGYYLGLRVRIGAAKGIGSLADEVLYMELGGSF